MESPQEIGMDTVPVIPLCVHEIVTRITVGLGQDGSTTRLIFSGHDENGTEMTVDALLPACLMDQLSTRLQEYQIAASVEGLGVRQPRVFRHLRSLILNRRQDGGAHDER